jgi:hypothetical protein
MRDFRAQTRISPASENALQFGSRQTGKSRRLGLFSPAWTFMPKRAIGQAEFRAYMWQTHP